MIFCTLHNKDKNNVYNGISKVKAVKLQKEKYCF